MIKVVIVMPTYNLEEYVCEAIESVLKQKTNFEYKLLIADDCSSDNTLNIIAHYSKKYPNKIEVITSEKNCGLLTNTNRVFDGIECEYLANLDGDDYWVSEYQLQQQVDYMDSNPDCFLCAGNTQYLVNGKLGDMLVNPEKLNCKYTFDDFLCERMPFFHTSAILLRNKIFINGIPSCFKDAVGTFEECALRGEDFRRILHLEKGYLYAMDTNMSVYRVHDKGLWQGTSNLRHLLEWAIASNFRAKFFNDKYGTAFERKKKDAYRHLISYLFLEKDFINRYELEEKDSFLFTSLLNDMGKNNSTSKYREKGNLKKKILKKLLKLM